MLVIKFADDTVVWNDDKRQWVCENKTTEDLLNFSLPDELNYYDAPLRTGGLQGVAYRAVKKKFGDLIEVVQRTEPPAIEEEEGVDENVV